MNTDSGIPFAFKYTSTRDQELVSRERLSIDH